MIDYFIKAIAIPHTVWYFKKYKWEKYETLLFCSINDIYSILFKDIIIYQSLFLSLSLSSWLLFMFINKNHYPRTERIEKGLIKN